MSLSATVDTEPVRELESERSSTVSWANPPLESSKLEQSVDTLSLPAVTADQFRNTVWVTLTLGFLAYTSRMGGVSHDMYHAMALFREALNNGWVPSEDVFAYTPTVSPSVHHEWGFGAILYFFFGWLNCGGVGLMAMKYTLLACIVAACVMRNRILGSRWMVFAAMAPLAWPLFWPGFGTVRAQLFTLVFLAVQLWMFARDRQGDRWWVLAWVPLHWIWLNVHAGFVVGLIAFGCYCVEVLWNEWAERGFATAVRKNWHLPATLLVLTACTWLNPYGGLYIQYLWEGLQMERPLIVEWRPLWHTYNPVLVLSVWALTVGLTLYAIRQHGLRRAFSCVLVLLAAYMAMKHLRHGSLYAVIWLATVPALLQSTPIGQRIEEWIRAQRLPIYTTSRMCCVAFLFIVLMNRIWEPNMGEGSDYPIATAPVTWLEKANFEGNLMTPFHTGAYVSWKLYPRVKISMDGRYEAAFPEGALEEAQRFYSAKDGWQETLARYDTDAVLMMRKYKVAKEFRKMAESDQNDAGWRQVYIDDAYVIYAKSATGLEPVDRTGETLIARFP